MNYGYAWTIVVSVLLSSFGLSSGSAQTINWVYANGYARNHPNVGVVADEFIKRIDSATNGRLKIRHVAGGTLLKPENMLDGLRNRVAQMGAVVLAFSPGQLPIGATLGGITDLEVGNKLDSLGVTKVTMKFLEVVPEFAAEFEKLGLKPVLWLTAPPYSILTTKPVAAISDLRGLKIRAFGDTIPQILNAAGAAPISIAFGEIYTSLQSGVIDGAIGDANAIVTGKFYEVSKNFLTFGPKDGAFTGLATVVYVVNLEDWKALPADVQTAFEKITPEMTLKAADMVNEAGNASMDTMRKAGVVFRHLSQEDTDALAAKTPNVWVDAAKKLKDANLPGESIVRRYHEVANAYLNGSLKP